MTSSYVNVRTGKTVVRPPRPYEIELRKRMVDAVRFADENKVPLSEVAKTRSLPWSTLQETSVVLRFGSPEQISALEIGMLSLREAARELRKVKGRERRPMILSADAKAMNVSESLVFAKLRDALENIAALPRPSDVVVIVKRQPGRLATVQKNLSTAYSWIEEFADAWTK